MQKENDGQDIVEKLKSDRMSRREFLIGASATVVGGLLAGCTSGATSPTAAPTLASPSPTEVGTVPSVTSLPTPTGTLILLSAQSFGPWNPAKTGSISNMQALTNIFSRLVGHESGVGVVPSLATSWKTIPDGLEFSLRPGVKFHDGKIFTAADVKATMELLSDQTQVTGALFAEPIAGKVIDDYTVQLITRFPLPVLGNCAVMPMLSKADIDAGKLDENLNGTGPFKWVKYEGETLYLTANADCWEGPPGVKDVQFAYVADPGTRLAALQKGEAHVSMRVTGDQVATIEQNPDLYVDEVVANEMIYMYFKCQREHMGNAALRQAIACCMDNEGIVEGIMQGYARVPQGYVAPELYPPNLSTPEMMRFDLDMAKAKLVEAGYPNGEGLPELVAIAASGYLPNMKEYCEYFVASCAKVGINVRLDLLETAAFMTSVYQNDSCDITFGVLGAISDVDLPLRMMIGGHGGGGGLTTGFYDPAIDALLDKAAMGLTTEERVGTYTNELLPALAEECVVHPIFNNLLLTGVNKKLKGWVTPPSNLMNVKDVYLQEA